MNNLQIFNNNEFGEIRTAKVGDKIWFVGKDIAKKLGYINVSDALIRHIDKYDRKKIPIQDSRGIVQRTSIINKEGVISLVAKRENLTPKEKEQFLLSLKIQDKIFLYSKSETEFGEQLILFMNQLGYKVERQYKILNYYIDFYITELNIAIEYDEGHHKYQQIEDRQRELEIQKGIGCKFIRIDDGLNIGTQLGQIIKYIKEEI